MPIMEHLNFQVNSVKERHLRSYYQLCRQVNNILSKFESCSQCSFMLLVYNEFRMKGEDDMKKKLGLAIGGIVAAGILGLGIFYSGASEAEAAMTTDEIKGVVEKQYPGDITDVKQDTEINRAVYEVEVSGDKKKYSLKLDGDTGDVLDIQEKSVKNPDKTVKDEEKKANKAEKAKEKESKSHKKENDKTQQADQKNTV